MFDLHRCDCRQWMAEAQPDTVDMVFCSPEYVCKGTRYINGQQKWDIYSWVEYHTVVVRLACRVSRGYVFLVVNGTVKSGAYQPACEALVWQCFTEGITCERPAIWHKNAPPNRRDYFRNDWEYVLAFKGADKPYFDWKAIAEPLKYTSGGHFRQRGSNGQRRRGSGYPQGKLARPHDVRRHLVGGGHMGHTLAHDNEAPFPVSLAKDFVLTCCPEGGIVLDPFCGSGSTGQACLETGRRFIGLDIRSSQIELAQRRLDDVMETMPMWEQCKPPEKAKGQ